MRYHLIQEEVGNLPSNLPPARNRYHLHHPFQDNMAIDVCKYKIRHFLTKISPECHCHDVNPGRQLLISELGNSESSIRLLWRYYLTRKNPSPDHALHGDQGGGLAQIRVGLFQSIRLMPPLPLHPLP